MNRRNLLLALAASVFATNSAAFDWALPTRKGRRSLLIAGSGTMLALNKALAAAFFKSHPLIDMVVEKGGSLAGLIALKRGAIDVGAMSRDLTVAEDEFNIRGFLVAKNEVSIVVNRRLPITSLFREQIRAIFNGKITNWKQAGGPDAPVRVISLMQGSTSRQFIEDVVLGGHDIIASAREAGSAKELSAIVAADPFAIGYISLKDHEGVADVPSIAVDGVTASRATIISERYPYTQPLFLLLYGDKPGPAADFVAFARSPAGQKIVEQQGLVSVC